MVHNKPHTAAAKAKISKGVMGKNNGMHKDGRRSYRRLAGAKPGDGTFIHHKNENRHSNCKSNLVKMSETKHKSHHMAKTNKAGITGKKRKK